MCNIAYYAYQFTPMDSQYQQCWTQVPQLFVSHKLEAKLQVHTTMPLTITLPIGKTMVATLAIQLDMLIDDLIYI